MKLKLLPVLSLLILSIAAHAEVTLPKLFSSHMVIQRGVPVHVWGDAAPGEKVSADFRNLSGTTEADELGRWQLTLPPAGEPVAPSPSKSTAPTPSP